MKDGDKRISQAKINRAVALQTDKELFRNEAKRLGALAAQSLGRNKRSQITGLESIANGTQRVSDVFNYIKIRTARQREWKEGNIGQDLLNYLEGKLSETCHDICVDLQKKDFALDDYQKQEIFMLLIRSFVAQFAAHYEYTCMESEQKRAT